MGKIIVVILLMLAMSGCGNLSQKDAARLEFVDEVTDILLDMETEQEKE